MRIKYSRFESFSNKQTRWKKLNPLWRLIKALWKDDQVSVFWHGGLRCCRRALPTYAGLSVGARLIPAHYPGPSQLSGTESPGATAPAVREIQMFPVKSDGKSYKTLICSKRGIK